MTAISFNKYFFFVPTLFCGAFFISLSAVNLASKPLFLVLIFSQSICIRVADPEKVNVLVNRKVEKHNTSFLALGSGGILLLLMPTRVIRNNLAATCIRT